MKISNKLLIAFASAMILIPLLGMIYVSQVNYKVGSYAHESSTQALNDNHFNTPSANMTSKALQAFTTVTIDDAKDRGINIHFINDDKFGVKVQNDVKDLIDFAVDANGQLKIRLGEIGGGRYSYTRILIYGPNVNQLNVTNASALILNAKSDSLAVNAKKSGTIQLQYGLSLNSLTIKTEQVRELNASEIDVKSLNLNLKETNFKSWQNSYDQLAITSAGKSEIEINTLDDSKVFLIKNLVVNTLNEVDFKIENTKVEKCSGSFSDQTKVQMPANLLNQMYKK
jgi:hypothetical protein